MDRDTIKNLLMTTSVVAIIAGSGQEAKAVNTCTENFTGANGAISQTTNVNCINITNATVSGDVTIAPNVIVGTPPPATTATNTELRLSNATISGAVTNNGTIVGNVNSAGFPLLKQFGIRVTNNSTVGNGVTNGGTGVISINISNTSSSAPDTSTGVAIRVDSSRFSGNVVNNGAIDVTVFVDPTSSALAKAFGIEVVSTSFVGNVINTNSLNVTATAVADLAGATNVAEAHANGLLVSAGAFSGTSNLSGSSTLTFSGASTFKGNVANSGVINNTAIATAISSVGGAGSGATSVADANGILVIGPSVSGTITNTGSGTVAATFTELFTGNLTNSNQINSTATAFSVQGGASAPVAGPVNANASANAFGIRLLGGVFSGSLTNGSTTSIAVMQQTILADFNANIANTDLINVNAAAQATAFSSDGSTALATARVNAVGIDVVGVLVNANVFATGLGSVTNTYSGTYVGNISNSGAINVTSTALGIAGTSALASVDLTQDVAGIQFVGARVTGTVANTGSGGNILNSLNATFLGNITNSGGITVNANSTGTSTSISSSGTAAVAINSNANGINVVGGSFSGNVIGTGVGTVDNFGTFSFSGNITNTSSGVINVNNQAFGLASLSVTGGEYINHVVAHAAGIRLVGGAFSGNTSGNNISFGANAFLTGNITNNGTIAATASALASITGSNGGVDVFANAQASGIEVLAAITSGRAIGFGGSFTGNIANTGKINAFATAIARTTNVTAVGNTFFTAQASANGILAVLTRMTGNVINTGSIGAFSTAVVTVTTGIGNSQAFAFADGIDVRASTFTGSIGNSAGSIRVFATAFNSDTGVDVLASADANGIYADSGSFFNGNIGNNALIVVTSNASVTPSGGTALAVAAGISLTAGELFTGTVTNSLGGSITAQAIANGNTAANATATGIAVDASTIIGDVVNNGFIQAFASATAFSGVTGTATAQAAGIHVGDAGGPPLSSFIGNINNTGVMTAFATAVAANTAFAAAEGIIVANTLGSGHFSNVSVVSGNIINSGSIGVGAFAASSGIANALAAGMFVATSTFLGNIANGGTIVAQAGAAASTAITGGPTANAEAFGIAAVGGTGDAGFTRTLSGNISNTSSGIISATATALAGEFANPAPDGLAFARSAGILVAGGFTDRNFELFGVSTITGSVANQGLIMSTASVSGSSTAVAQGYGIDVLFSTFVGSVSNTGTVSATALGTVVDGSVQASAGGMVVAGFDFGNGFSGPAQTFSGNISNSGVVSAFANAVTVFGSTANADAVGIFLNASTAIGSITNSSTGLILANANASGNELSGPGSFVRSSAFATGIFFSASTFVGNVSNGGTISAHASANAAADFSSTAIANAAGIRGVNLFFIGNVSNTGLIGAFATANALAFGDATAIADAAGIDLIGVVGVGTIANTGTLVQVSTFVGNIKNAGTIMAIGTAIAQSNTATARALDPATGIRVQISDFFGVVQNNGLIIAEATADATGPSATAVALAAGIGINAVSAGGINVQASIGTSDSLFPTTIFSGSIANGGTIMVNASAHTHGGFGSEGTVVAGATGIRVFSSVVLGNVSNSGFIQATATATNNSIDNVGTAFAAGIHIGGVTAGRSLNFAQTTFFFGNVTNSGTIGAFATSTTNDNVYAAGIQFDVILAEAIIDNSKNGVLSAAAFVTGSGSAFADVDGIYIHSSLFLGNISNEGTIIATATAGPIGTALAFADGIDAFAVSIFSGSISNAGVIMVGATAVNASNEAFAEASGILTEAVTHLGDITNTGTIMAFATAQSNSGGGNQRVHAAGIYVASDTFIGNVTNTGGLISAKVSAPTFGSPSSGTASGIGIHANTFIGNVNNTGTVIASSDGTGLGALGVHIGGISFVGNLNNSGLIFAMGDATGIYSNPSTSFVGAINNTGTVIGTGGATDRGIRVVGPSILLGINNSGTVQGGFASIDMDEETGPGTTINNQSKGLLKGDVRLSSTADTLNVFGGSTVMGNISGNVSGGGTIGNFDTVNFDLNNDGLGHTLTNGFSVYQFKITNVDTVNLITGTLVLDDQDVVGTVTLGPGNIDPVGKFNQTAGSTLGLVVDVGHPTSLGPTTAPTQQTLTITSGIGFVQANTVNISTGASFKAFEEADFYANTNIYPNVVVGLTEMNGNYLNDGIHVLSNSPLFDAFMVENGGGPAGNTGGPPGSDTLVLTRRAFNHPLGVGLTPNENAAGLGLESLYKTGNGTAFAVIPSLFTVSAADYPLVLKSLDGETILERPDLWQTVLDSILHRLSQGEGFNGQGVAGAMLNHGPIQVASAGFSDDNSEVAQTTPMPGPNGVVRPWSAWIRGYGVFGSGPSTINATSFDENRYGGIGGIDYHVSDNLLVGGIFNYSHGEVNLDAPTPAKNKQDAYQFAAYGKYQQGPWYANLIAGGGFTDNSETRQVLKPTIATVNGSYSGETFMVYGEAGWDLYPMRNVKLTPLVGVGYNWLRYDGFQESGSPSALTVQESTTNNLYTALGARAQTAINIGTSAPLVPEVRVVWEHEFLDANQEMNASFGGAGLFNVQGSKFSRESVIAGIGVSNNVAPDLKVFLDYDAKIQGGYAAHAVSAGLRWSFGGAAPMPPPAAPPPVPAAQPAPPPPAQAQTFVVYFDFDKSNLTPEAMGIIRQAADTFKRTGAVTLKVDGYTDLAGTAKYNIGLSKRRADVVRAELVKDGVPNNAVAEAWHGKDNPAVPTPDGVREPRNRRATIMLP